MTSEHRGTGEKFQTTRDGRLVLVKVIAIEQPCERCGEPFVAHDKRQRYCSPKCADKARYARWMERSSASSSPLRSARYRQGLTLREVSRRTGIDVSQLSRIERGQSQPSVGTLARLADCLEMTELAAGLAPYAPVSEGT